MFYRPTVPEIVRRYTKAHIGAGPMVGQVVSCPALLHTYL